MKTTVTFFIKKQQQHILLNLQFLFIVINISDFHKHKNLQGQKSAVSDNVTGLSCALCILL